VHISVIQIAISCWQQETEKLGVFWRVLEEEVTFPNVCKYFSCIILCRHIWVNILSPSGNV